ILLPFSSGAAEKLDPALHLLRAISTFHLGLGIAKGVASDATNYLVALQSATSNQLIAQFLGPTGVPVGSSIDLGVTGTPPLVSFDGSNYLVVWAGGTEPSFDIYGQFISGQGAMVGPALVIGSDTGAADVGGIQFDGSNYFVVWE